LSEVGYVNLFFVSDFSLLKTSIDRTDFERSFYDKAVYWWSLENRNSIRPINLGRFL